MLGRIVIFTARGGKGFSLKAVLAVGSGIATLLSGGSFLLGKKSGTKKKGNKNDKKRRIF